MDDSDLKELKFSAQWGRSRRFAASIAEPKQTARDIHSGAANTNARPFPPLRGRWIGKLDDGGSDKHHVRCRAKVNGGFPVWEIHWWLRTLF